MNLSEGQIKAQQLASTDGLGLNAVTSLHLPHRPPHTLACFVCSQAEQEGGPEEQHTPQKPGEEDFCPLFPGLLG